MTIMTGTRAFLALCSLGVGMVYSNPLQKPRKQGGIEKTITEKASAHKPSDDRASRPGMAADESPATEEPVADILSQYAMLAAGADDQEEAKDVFFYSCKHIRSTNMKKLLENFLTPAGMVADSDEADVVIVSDVKSNLAVLKNIAANMDKPVAQILVEARIVEFTVDNQFEKEVNLAFQHFKNIDDIPGAPGNSLDFVKRLTDAFVPAGSSPANTQGNLAWSQYDAKHHNLLSVFIKFLETRGRARILSSPNLILRRGTEGSIITGEEVPIQTQTLTSGSVSTSTTFKSVGIKLRVTPVMIAGNKVRMKVSPEVSNVTRVDQSGAPIIAVRNANTELEMLDGQMVSIGGLLRTEEREVERRVPILGSIPILGHLFRGKEKQSVQSQLVIFLSMKILTPEDLEEVQTVGNAPPKKVQDTIDRMEKSIRKPEPSFKSDLKRLKE